MAKVYNDLKFIRRKTDNNRPRVALLQGLTLLGFLAIFALGKGLTVLLDCSCVCN